MYVGALLTNDPYIGLGPGREAASIIGRPWRGVKSYTDWFSRLTDLETQQRVVEMRARLYALENLQRDLMERPWETWDEISAEERMELWEKHLGHLQMRTVAERLSIGGSNQMNRWLYGDRRMKQRQGSSGIRLIGALQWCACEEWNGLEAALVRYCWEIDGKPCLAEAGGHETPAFESWWWTILHENSRALNSRGRNRREEANHAHPITGDLQPEPWWNQDPDVDWENLAMPNGWRPEPSHPSNGGTG